MGRVGLFLRLSGGDGEIRRAIIVRRRKKKEETQEEEEEKITALIKVRDSTIGLN